MGKRTAKTSLGVRRRPRRRSVRLECSALRADQGEADVRVLRLVGIESPAWQLYSDSIHSLGRGELTVETTFAPAADRLSISSRAPIVYHFMKEADSSIERMVPRSIDGAPALGVCADLDGPLEHPRGIQYHDTGAVDADACPPEPKCPATDALNPGNLYATCPTRGAAR